MLSGAAWVGGIFLGDIKEEEEVCFGPVAVCGTRLGCCVSWGSVWVSLSLTEQPVWQETVLEVTGSLCSAAGKQRVALPARISSSCICCCSVQSSPMVEESDTGLLLLRSAATGSHAGSTSKVRGLRLGVLVRHAGSRGLSLAARGEEAAGCLTRRCS